MKSLPKPNIWEKVWVLTKDGVGIRHLVRPTRRKLIQDSERWTGTNWSKMRREGWRAERANLTTY